MRTTINSCPLGYLVLFMATLALPSLADARGLTGAEGARGKPRRFLATYTVTHCTDTATNSLKALPSALTYYLEQLRRGRLALRELNIRLRGYYFINHWVDQDGDHFFAYSRRGSGFEYILPSNRSKPGVRLVYNRGEFRAFRAPGRIIKPSGTPSLRCQMLPPGWSTKPAKPKQEKKASPKVSAAKSGCTKDTECKGERICVMGVCADPPEPAEEEEAAPPKKKHECEQDIDCDGDQVCKDNRCVAP